MPVTSMHEAVLSSADADYLADLYKTYLQNRGMIDSSWAAFFDDLGDEAESLLGELQGATWQPDPSRFEVDAVALAEQASQLAEATNKRTQNKTVTTDELRRAALDSVRALMLIRSYRVRGHLAANLDPLGLHEPEDHPELDPLSYGFEKKDFEHEIFINGVLGLETATLDKIVRICRRTYCGTIGVEFMHIQFPDEKQWIQERIEGARNQTDFTERGKKAILERLTAAETFEQFLQKKFTGTKRFGLEGGEAIVPGIEQIMKRGGQMGLKEIVVGMAHRGRLNMLTNVLGKSFSSVFAEFLGHGFNLDSHGSGDVKYHLGTSGDRNFDGNEIHLSLTANPSHLEAVNPVVLGKVRAKQDRGGDAERSQVMAILLHGDAAMAGQGVVSEGFHLSELQGYMTGGTIHLVINNQIGFTTLPRYSRSSTYCTDVAKQVQAPILHVNGDDPEAVVHAARIATEYRMRFQKDIVIDMFCYRRHGHNEGDEPSFTQPMMYKAIGSHPTTRTIYAQKLIEEGVISTEEAQGMKDGFDAKLEQEFKAAESYKANSINMLDGAWKGLELASGTLRRGDTDVDIKTLKRIGLSLLSVPEDFNLNKKIARQMDAKRKMFEGDEPLDWAMGESLAFGTLLSEGFPVRLSGQDSGRGTFSQRHAILYDQEKEGRYFPLRNLPDQKARFEVWDSPLSEFSVLGFEYGYSLSDPSALVLWEGQFGDFVNGAQVIIDQFLSSGETKWLRMSGLVMLLPHGYEGQGPEHSSARLERFLQLSAEDNWQVANCSTPANYFHILRRQMHRKFRKPLVLMTPKSLLRHKLCVSPLSDFATGSHFRRVLTEDNIGLQKDDKIKRVVLCSGKVYYDLYQARAEKEIDDIHIVRLEQLYPFPDDRLKEIFARHPKADIVWCQEEPANMGAWSFVRHRIEDVLSDMKHACVRPSYSGRAEAASPATGLASRHAIEQERLVNEALAI